MIGSWVSYYVLRHEDDLSTYIPMGMKFYTTHKGTCLGMKLLTTSAVARFYKYWSQSYEREFQRHV
jgi:hypothetical protein